MRVLLISGSYPPDACGVGDYTMRLARALAKQPDWEVAVLTGPAASGGAPGGVTDELPAPTVIHCPGAWAFSALPRIVTAVRQWAPDVVHFQYPTQGFFGWRLPALLPALLRCLGFPSVQTWHEPPPTGVRAMIYFLLPRLGARAGICPAALSGHLFPVMVEALGCGVAICNDSEHSCVAIVFPGRARAHRATCPLARRPPAVGRFFRLHYPP